MHIPYYRILVVAPFAVLFPHNPFFDYDWGFVALYSRYYFSGQYFQEYCYGAINLNMDKEDYFFLNFLIRNAAAINMANVMAIAILTEFTKIPM